MSINLWNAGDLFTARVYKSLATRPDLVWANTYELQVNGTGEGGDANDARAVARCLANFESLLHLADVRFNRVVFSTLAEDGQPYDPDSFASYDFSGLSGTRIPAGEVQAQPLQVCLLVRKLVNFGRAGRFLYRRVLTEAEVTSTAGDPALAAGVQATLEDVMGTNVPTFEAPLPEALVALGVDLVMAGETGGITRVRQVTGLSPVGVVIKKYNNRYFDRVNAAP